MKDKKRKDEMLERFFNIVQEPSLEDCEKRMRLSEQLYIIYSEKLGKALIPIRNKAISSLDETLMDAYIESVMKCVVNFIKLLIPKNFYKHIISRVIDNL